MAVGTWGASAVPRHTCVLPTGPSPCAQPLSFLWAPHLHVAEPSGRCLARTGVETSGRSEDTPLCCYVMCVTSGTAFPTD